LGCKQDEVVRLRHLITKREPTPSSLAYHPDQLGSIAFTKTKPVLFQVAIEEVAQHGR
jgi:hypothetical protein